MDPIRKISKKFTKKSSNKVINRQYFCWKTGLNSLLRLHGFLLTLLFFLKSQKTRKEITPCSKFPNQIAKKSEIDIFCPLNFCHNRKKCLLDVLLPSPATVASCKSDDENTAPRDLKYDIVWPSKSDMKQAK